MHQGGLLSAITKITRPSTEQVGRPVDRLRAFVHPLCTVMLFRGRGAPGRPSARHSMATRSHSSVLQNGCSSASLMRLSRLIRCDHRSCGLACLLISRQRAPADRRQQESLLQGLWPAPAVRGNMDRARLQDLQRPGSTCFCWWRSDTPARRAPRPLLRQAGRWLLCMHLCGELVQAQSRRPSYFVGIGRARAHAALWRAVRRRSARGAAKARAGCSCENSECWCAR